MTLLEEGIAKQIAVHAIAADIRPHAGAWIRFGALMAIRLAELYSDTDKLILQILWKISSALPP